MKASIKNKLYFYFGISIIFTSMLSSGFFFLRYRNELENGINERIRTGAVIAMKGVDMSRLTRAWEPGFRETEDYLSIMKYLKTAERSLGLKYIYIMTKKDNDLVFVYDSGNYEPEDGYEDSFLVPYTDRPAALDKAWNIGMETTAEYTDKWGSFRSMFMPVKDGSGRVIATIGVDYSIEKVKTTMKRSYAVFGVIAGLIMLITLLAVYRLRGAIITPIMKIITEVTGISESSDLTARTSVSGSDELGLLGQSFNSFIDRSQGIIREIGEISGRLAASSQDFTSVSMNLAQTKSDITKEAAYTASTITDLVHRITTLSDEQMDLFVSLRKLIEDLYAGIQTVNTQADRTLSLSSNVAANAMKGGESISTMNASMDKVMKSSNDMIGIIEIINDISDRINLLSLNAAIEAARAGEAGRGFAVVAEEISKLADQTADSTKNIDSLIRANSDEIGREISNLESTTSILNLIISGVEQMKTEVTAITSVAAEQLGTAGKLRENSGSIFTRAGEIRDIAASQQDALDAITRSISNIDDYTATITSGAERISTSSQDVASMAQELRERLSHYKV